MKPISEGIYGLLVSQGVANAKLVGAGKVRGMGAGMLEGTAHPLAAQAGENREPMGMSKMDELYKPYRTYGEEAGAAKAPASIVGGDQAREPSSADGRPVLRLLQGGSSKRSATPNVTLRLVL